MPPLDVVRIDDGQKRFDASLSDSGLAMLLWKIHNCGALNISSVFGVIYAYPIASKVVLSIR